METKMRVGDFLVNAERRLREMGGYQAEVDIDARTVVIFHHDATGERVIVGTGPHPEDQAMEDSATDLLEELRPRLCAEKLAFAKVFFPIGFAP